MTAAREVEREDVAASYRSALSDYLMHAEDELGLLRAYDCGRDVRSFSSPDLAT